MTQNVSAKNQKIFKEVSFKRYQHKTNQTIFREERIKIYKNKTNQKKGDSKYTIAKQDKICKEERLNTNQN